MKTIRVLLIVWLFGIALLAQSIAQPPAQGPNDPGANANSLSTSLLTGILKSKVEEILATTNADLAARDDFRAKVSSSFVEFSPHMLATQHLDRPNQRYVRIPYIFTYTVTNMRKNTAVGWISYPFSRKISQSIEINVTCNRWFLSTGEITVAAQGDPPYLDPNHSIPEQALNIFVNGWLADTIDSRIRTQLRNLGVSTGNIGLNSPCNTLGVATIAEGFPYNSVEFKKFPRSRFDVPFADDVTVKVLRIKRLRARDFSGQPLYDLSENINVDFYVNQQGGQGGSFTMVEGNEAAITSAPIRFHRPSSNQNVVLIFNVRQNVNPYTVDSNYTVHTSGQNFGHGTHTVQIYKTYWMPPRPPINKPLKISVPAYEITYEINAPQIVIQQK
jgi:hypothetical protein